MNVAELVSFLTLELNKYLHGVDDILFLKRRIG